MEIQDYTKHDGVAVSAELLNATKANVEALLMELYPEAISFGDGSFTLTRGSATVMIIVRPFTENEICVECIANLTTGSELTPEVLKYLLRKNTELHFGGFGLLFDDTIAFSYALPGSNLCKEELYTAVNAVAIIADYYDDEIVKMAGGRLSKDVEAESLQD